MKICGTELQIIEGTGNVTGIRDKGGYLLFFPRVSRYSGQNQRYADEMAQQKALAEFILSALENYPGRIVDDKPIEVGSNVIIYDRNRLVMPAKGTVLELYLTDLAMIELDSLPISAPTTIPKRIWVHKAQLRLAPDDANDEDHGRQA